MTVNIYINKALKYPLTYEEYDKINETWRFIKTLKTNEIILSVNKRYKIEEFYEYEKIANKLNWNMFITLSKILNKSNEDIINIEDYTDKKDLDIKIKQTKAINSNYYRSFINKIVIVDTKNRKIISKSQEGSSKIFVKNNLNKIMSNVLYNRELYEEIMNKGEELLKNKEYLLKITPKYNIQHDYCFPNLNRCVYNFGDKKLNINRIKKYYYNATEPKDKYWFKLILE